MCCLLERYNGSVGQQLEDTNTNEPFKYIYFAKEDYFTVYTQNASLIGKISDNLRNKIIAAYIGMKGLLDTYKMNNDMLEKFNYFETLALEAKLSIHKEKMEAYYKMLSNYTSKINNSHKTTVSMIKQLCQ